MRVVRVDSAADPRIAPYANLRDAELRQRLDPTDTLAHAGLFVAEGDLVVRTLVRSRFEVVSLLTTAQRLEKLDDVLTGLDPGVPIYVAEQEVLNGIVGFNIHRGLLALGRRGTPMTLEDVLSGQRDGRQDVGPLVVLEDLTNHDNLGGIFRNVAALAGPTSAVLLSPRCADPLYRKCLRVSMGLALTVPTARSASWPEDLARIGHAGFTTWALTPSSDAIELSEALSRAKHEARGRRIALVLGSEGPGLTSQAMSSCEKRVRLGMWASSSAVDSLNVAVSAGIALYQLRQSIGD